MKTFYDEQERKEEKRVQLNKALAKSHIQVMEDKAFQRRKEQKKISRDLYMAMKRNQQYEASK